MEVGRFFVTIRESKLHIIPEVDYRAEKHTYNITIILYFRVLSGE